MKSFLLLRNIFPDNTKINFMRVKYITLISSLILVIATFAGLYFKSLNFGIDFTGGLLFEVRMPEAPDLVRIRNNLNNLALGEITIQNLGESNDILIRAAVKDETKQQYYIDAIKETLLSKTSANVEFRKIEFVGAEVGSEMIYKGIIAIVMTFVGIIIYVWFRFNWQYSVGIVVGLMHDVILTVGFLVITRYEFNVTSVAAILTILGYSVNDTVVIYDRVREKMRTTIRTDITSILNDSINETLSRTLLTVLTTLLAAAVLIFFGGEALKSFSITVFIGIVVGTYSSIFTSIPVLQLFKWQRN
jgi:preprotein translocase subunit SecF